MHAWGLCRRKVMGPTSPLHQSQHRDTEVLRAQLLLPTSAVDPLCHLLAFSPPDFTFSKVFAAIAFSSTETHFPALPISSLLTHPCSAGSQSRRTDTPCPETKGLGGPVEVPPPLLPVAQSPPHHAAAHGCSCGCAQVSCTS